mmetsp:Transcript_10830/g.17728  ORF Transcript_10830/g.17728 Transcript_10830/m.17728 type:complete len:325 (-) Transcript_10830:43-1017(-)|eukprot:CAMPEP_0203757960 /NCGR_PEP_ID=MMETSP0098-20131031/10780_1 /ASSEMBLY_ACC=CAM_ASM_000208 /TAXON_ID=96639 /ORGANISM=" , Strain NY0313808BC1" /LENGTH=324 /DNA_ID=CAMNT_0050650205 /DNA_START=288 /DNA_END=1262 /DNA_ORIENTATION=+
MADGLERRREQTGGASFSPRLNPRPQYPGWVSIVKRALVAYTRAPFLMSVFTVVTYPRYVSLVNKLRGKGWNDNKIFMVLSVCLHSGLYFGVAGIFKLFDVTGLFSKYKMARKGSQLAGDKLHVDTLKEAFVNQFVVGPIAAYYGWNVLKQRGFQLDGALPGFFSLMRGFAVAHLFNDFFFYWAHRLVHSKPLYKIIHKQHHKYIGSESIAAEYAHPVEQVLANQMPTLGGMVLFGSHAYQFWVWLAYRLEETYESHSGYCFSGSLLDKLGLLHGDNASFHDAHHSENRGNFGTGNLVMDWTFGTMDAWVAKGLEHGYLEKKQI